MILGIDPGPVESAYCLVDRQYNVIAAGKVGAGQLIRGIRCAPPAEVVVESIQSYGMVVGRTVFDTCYVVGRLFQVCEDKGIPFTLYPRPEYTRRICGVGKVNDAVVRQALCLRFGADNKGGPLYALKGNSDKRSAFALAVYHIDLTTYNRQHRPPHGAKEA